MSQPPSDLQALREALEALDGEILGLLKRRMGLVERVADAKLDRAVPFRDQEREEHVLQRVRHQAAEHGLDPHEIERLYRLVMGMSIAQQQAHIHSRATAPLRVAYQGVEGSYSHLTAQRRWAGRPGGVLLTGFASVRQAADAVRQGHADLALLPVENTTAGSIHETYDQLAAGGVTVTGEVVSVIEHCLLALPGVGLDELRTVLSHPQGLAQCEDFLHRHPQLAARAEFDTAGAARKVRESNDRSLGAIASAAAARRYGLAVLGRGIQSRAGNFTRFFAVALEAAPCPPDVPCKTTLLLATVDEPGALGKVLTELGARGVNLSKLESRPRPGVPWQYRFYLDLEGHAASEPVAAALDAVRPLTAELRVLGTYPRAGEAAVPGAPAEGLAGDAAGEPPGEAGRA